MEEVMKSAARALRVFFGAADAPPFIAPKALRMLFVDDEEDSHAIGVGNAGYESVLAANATEALRLAQSMITRAGHRPDDAGHEWRRTARFSGRNGRT